jgi:peptide/nickel transport system ATP-binding protein
MRSLRRHLQIVFQDPSSSLDPLMTIRQIIEEPLRLHGESKVRRYQRATELMVLVELSTTMMDRYPHELSGGQRQRVGIARALALKPSVLVLDEPVSSLDVSVQAGIINLLEELQEQTGVSYLFVAHNLQVVAHISDRVAVMYRGRIVETGSTSQVLGNPHHPYTQALVSAAPIPDPLRERNRRRVLLADPVIDGVDGDRSAGCQFRDRCPVFHQVLAASARELCRTVDPRMPAEPTGADRAACHHTGIAASWFATLTEEGKTHQ